MRKPEQQLWDDLSRTMHGRWYAERVENRVGSNMPDVYFVLPEIGDRHDAINGWIELKQIFKWNRYKTQVTKVSNFTAGQKRWLAQNHRTKNGNAWLLLHVRLTDEYIFLPGDKAGIVGDVTQPEVYINSYEHFQGMPHPGAIRTILGLRGA